MADGGVVTLRQRVEEAIAGSGDTVVNRVVDAFVESEVKRRADVVTAAVNTIRQLEADEKKIKPDVVHVNEDGSPAASLFTPAKQKELANLRQKKANLDAALATVLGAHTADNYNKLDQAIKKASSKGGNDKNADSGDGE